MSAPATLDSLLLEAYRLFSQRDFAAAKQQLEQALALAPEHGASLRRHAFVDV